MQIIRLALVTLLLLTLLAGCVSVPMPQITIPQNERDFQGSAALGLNGLDFNLAYSPDARCAGRIVEERHWYKMMIISVITLIIFKYILVWKAWSISSRPNKEIFYCMQALLRPASPTYMTVVWITKGLLI